MLEGRQRKQVEHRRLSMFRRYAITKDQQVVPTQASLHSATDPDAALNENVGRRVVKLLTLGGSGLVLPFSNRSFSALLQELKDQQMQTQ
jgi:hypothetical protein